jgi:hypothetical protein
VAAALAVLALKWSPGRRWFVAAGSGLLVFASVWIYTLLTTDYTFLN